mgnify:CR=1 FL=1|tara:strand:+ start:681 stop:1322 length:642 start_codon:yes stop_codon:yes gene_type:complete
MRNISPSLLSADFTKLAEHIKEVESAGVSRLHLDVMDGHFVPNLTFGPFIIKQIKEVTTLHLETHLMITEPNRYFDDYIKAGSDTLIFHFEASNTIKDDLKYIQSQKIKSGLAINPDTNIEVVIEYLDYIDYILIMSVFPGFGGQSFIESTLNKMRSLSEICIGKSILIGVDGGVNLSTIDRVYDHGADVTIVGSGLFKADNIQVRYNELMGE